MAQYYEENNDINNAIIYYKKSKLYSHALRLASSNENILNMNEINDIILEIPNNMFKKNKSIIKQNCNINDLNKCAILYQKCGNINKAIDLCINKKLFNQLKIITSNQIENNNNNIHPNIALKFSKYFMEYKQYEKAVHMLIIAKKYKNALNIISNYGIKITNELSEKLTPNKTENNIENRNEILIILAKLCCEQQLYQLAAKKYTQCGDKINAIKCLIQANDTNRVIYYASKTKNNNTNILAANYLQSLNWHLNPKYTKSILQFYNTAKAYKQLAFFYDACAQIEIDEYRDYDKALRVLKQALKQIKKN